MRKLVPILAALLLFAAACGSSGSDNGSKTDANRSTTTKAASNDEGSESGGGGADAAMAKAAGLTGKVNDHGAKSVAAGKSIDVEMDDDYFEPSYIKAPAGASITVELENEGSSAHTFTVDSLGIDQQVDPGQKAEVKVTMPKSPAGFHCNFHGSMGMQGGLIVPGASSSATGSGGATTTTMPMTTTSSSSGAGGGY